jgi:hypothetical protein
MLGKQAKEYLPHAGGLGFYDHGLRDFLNTLGCEHRGKPPHLPEEFLIGPVPDERGDEHVEQEKRDARRNSEDTRIPERQSKGQSVSESTRVL